MTEITRVPLRPIKKGSLTKLWLGVIVAILLGAGLAWAAVPKGVEVETLTEGVGPSPQIGDVVFANYVGTLPDGTEFDRSQPSPFPPEVFPAGTPFPLEEEGGLIQGFVDGLMQTQKGGKYRIEIPAEQAYGATPPPGSEIPANSDLVFEVEVTEIMSLEEAQQRFMQLQAQMGAQGGPGGPEGAPQQAPVE
ncbi:FKBP-type peptidyl-prolyl cis-trans isomerase [Qipengyuania seohaensis]|jgi:FKBP-type peptidyl-prolyl cis-trans isomerase FkpA|uniref:FKBP-type peptidyl-prolyl cis-trans isomerase n=1 Tax=Qipengyuania seohaensis TaxID=266951 RepID=UPI000C225CAF|nr:FKBP-type peptidyl-prolyl cis-trans isomerase [Qipengyuania seohaensis]